MLSVFCQFVQTMLHLLIEIFTDVEIFNTILKMKFLYERFPSHWHFQLKHEQLPSLLKMSTTTSMSMKISTSRWTPPLFIFNSSKWWVLWACNASCFFYFWSSCFIIYQVCLWSDCGIQHPSTVGGACSYLNKAERSSLVQAAARLLNVEDEDCNENNEDYEDLTGAEDNDQPSSAWLSASNTNNSKQTNTNTSFYKCL